MPTASVWWRAALCLLLVRLGWDANQHFQSEELVAQFEQALKKHIGRSRAGRRDTEPHLPTTAFCIDKPAYLAGRRDLALWNSLMGSHFPAMSMIFVADLLDAPAKIELEATSVIPA